MSIIATVEQLEAIYGEPNEASTVKVSAMITVESRQAGRPQNFADAGPNSC